jgi:Arc/MetJ-type ribon-helix-helix transcriptional regulator
MGTTRIAVPLDTRTLQRVDRLVGRGRFASRGQAIAAVVTETFRRGKESLTAAEVLRFVRLGRAEHRNGKTRVIGSSADLR